MSQVVIGGAQQPISEPSYRELPAARRWAARRQKGFGHRRDRRGLWFVLPFFVIFFMFLVVPLGYSIYTSFFTTRMIGGTVFTGFANYT